MFARLLKIAALSLLLASSTLAAEWGDLTGRFVYDGKAPEPTPISKVDPACAAHKLVDEIGRRRQGRRPGQRGRLSAHRKVDVSPDYEKTAKEDVVLDNKNCRFEPHVTVLSHHADAAGQELRPLRPQHEARPAEERRHRTVLLPAGAESKAAVRHGREPADQGWLQHPSLDGRLGGGPHRSVRGRFRRRRQVHDQGPARRQGTGIPAVAREEPVT